MNYEVTVEVEVEGTLRRGSKGLRTVDCPMGYPDDPDEVEGFRIMFGDKDVTDIVSEKEREAVYEQYLQALLEDDGV